MALGTSLGQYFHCFFRSKITKSDRTDVKRKFHIQLKLSGTTTVNFFGCKTILVAFFVSKIFCQQNQVQMLTLQAQFCSIRYFNGLLYGAFTIAKKVYQEHCYLSLNVDFKMGFCSSLGSKREKVWMYADFLSALWMMNLICISDFCCKLQVHLHSNKTNIPPSTFTEIQIWMTEII